ncbi:hypothetical protein RRG08_010266 [Elysia crispata]|uniref:Uncharacterized protein n=1 Tax=Elysia crispata TaxID=231223 RepID=A0AAE0Z2G5_9GAST|nr:hypothetical protein RRG08_010266 [Elysia crispata]
MLKVLPPLEEMLRQADEEYEASQRRDEAEAEMPPQEEGQEETQASGPLPELDEETEMMISEEVQKVMQKEASAKRPKLQMTSKVPNADASKPTKNLLGKAARLNQSYVLRQARGKYPTEIEYGVQSLNRILPPIDETMEEPLKSFMKVLRTYVEGGDPASSITFEVLEDRILRSTKAADESDSEHFQRIASALQIVQTMRTSKFDIFRVLVEMSQKDVSDARQHERFTEAIRIKAEKSGAEVAKLEVETSDARLDLEAKRKKGDSVDHLMREISVLEARSKIVLLKEFPDRPLAAYVDGYDDDVRNGRRRTAYDLRTDHARTHIGVGRMRRG